MKKGFHWLWLLPAAVLLLATGGNLPRASLSDDSERVISAQGYEIVLETLAPKPVTLYVPVVRGSISSEHEKEWLAQLAVMTPEQNYMARMDKTSYKAQPPVYVVVEDSQDLMSMGENGWEFASPDDVLSGSRTWGWLQQEVTQARADAQAGRAQAPSPWDWFDSARSERDPWDAMRSELGMPEEIPQWGDMNGSAGRRQAPAPAAMPDWSNPWPSADGQAGIPDLFNP